MTIIADIYLAIKTVYADQPVLRDLCFAQAVHESNLLHHPSKLAIYYNNFFGIKGKGTRGSILLPTWEHINGKDIFVKAAFAYNKTMTDSINQHKALMSKPRYKQVLIAPSFEEACQAVYKAGYATDPNYPSKLITTFEIAKRAL